MAKAEKEKTKSLTKAELIEKLAESMQSTKTEAGKAFDAVFDAIRFAVTKRKTCTVPQFGTFNLQTLKKRKGRNPRTNEEITIPASKTIRFKPSLTLKKEFNK